MPPLQLKHWQQIVTSDTAAPPKYSLEARIDRLPFSSWHLRVGMVIGSGWFFDAFDALAIAYVLPVLISVWGLTPGEVGVVISIGYAGQAIGSIFFGWLGERAGRVPCAQYTLLIFSIMSLACAFAPNYFPLLAMRFIQGLGLGGEIPIMATYISEIAPARHRARFSLGYQFFFAVGLVVVAFVGTRVVPAFGWRWMFAIGALPALLVLPLRRLLVESPRWLASRNRLKEADQVLTTIEDLVSRHQTKPLPPAPENMPPTQPSATRLADLFKGIYLRRTLCVWFLWLATNIVNYGLITWMPSVWRTIYHLPVRQSLDYGFITTAVGLAGTVSALLLLDIVGRKPMFTLGLLLCAVPLLVLAGKPGLEPSRVLALICVCFVCNAVPAFSLSTYTAEIYPTPLRALGTGIGNAWLRFAALAVPLIIGWMLPLWGMGSVFLLMGLCSLAGGVVCWLFAVETRGRPLEQLSPSI